MTRFDLAPIDVRLLLVALVLAAIIVSIVATALGIAYINTIIPPYPPFTPTQLETL